MSHLTLSEAARAAGKSKSAVWRAIKSGRVSASRGDDGDYRIDPSELSRAFPPEPPRHVPAAQNGTASGTTGNAEVAAVTAELIAELRARIADVTEDRDRWRTLAERTALPAPETRRRWWWRGRG
jgi:hypothetical protein